MIKNSKSNSKLQTRFVKYAQSNKVKSKKETSVSYAAGITYLE